VPTSATYAEENAESLALALDAHGRPCGSNRRLSTGSSCVTLTEDETTRRCVSTSGRTSTRC
jgi:hypothetical protein